MYVYVYTRVWVTNLARRCAAARFSFLSSLLSFSPLLSSLFRSLPCRSLCRQIHFAECRASGRGVSRIDRAKGRLSRPPFFPRPMKSPRLSAANNCRPQPPNISTRYRVFRNGDIRASVGWPGSNRSIRLKNWSTLHHKSFYLCIVSKGGRWRRS